MTKYKSWLSRAQLDALDERLFEYKHIERAISTRKDILMNERKHDSNIGGSKSGIISKPPEQITIKWSEDLELKNLYLFRDTVKECYDSLSDELKLIFHIRWEEGSGKTWPEIEKEMHIAKKGIYRKRTAILENFAEKAGYLNLRR